MSWAVFKKQYDFLVAPTSIQVDQVESLLTRVNIQPLVQALNYPSKLGD